MNNSGAEAVESCRDGIGSSTPAGRVHSSTIVAFLVGRLFFCFFESFDPLLGLGELQPDGIDPAADEIQRCLVLQIVARFHPGIHQRPTIVVDPQSGRMIGMNVELINARLLGQ